MGCSSSKPSYETQDSGVHELANADDAHKSEALKAEALRTADEMFEATKGRQVRRRPPRCTQNVTACFCLPRQCSGVLRKLSLYLHCVNLPLGRPYRRFHENYTRLTLTSYGASCKVLTAYHRVTNKKVAVKTIPKVRGTGVYASCGRKPYAAKPPFPKQSHNRG